MIDKRRLFLFGTLSTLVLSCNTPIVSVLEKNGAQRVGLTQIQRKPNKKRVQPAVIDTTQVYSRETMRKLKEGFTEYEKDDNGEEILSVSLADVQIVAKSKNVAERAGKIVKGVWLKIRPGLSVMLGIIILMNFLYVMIVLLKHWKND